MVLLVSGQPELEMDPEIFRRCSRVFSQMLLAYQKKLDGAQLEGHKAGFDRAASQKAWVSSCVVMGWRDTLSGMGEEDDILSELNQLCDRYRLSAFKDLASLEGSALGSFSVTYVRPEGFCDDSVYVDRSVDFLRQYIRYDLLHHYQADFEHQRAGLHDPKDAIADEIVGDILVLLDGFDAALDAIEAGMDWQP